MIGGKSSKEKKLVSVIFHLVLVKIPVFLRSKCCSLVRIHLSDLRPSSYFTLVQVHLCHCSNFLLDFKKGNHKTSSITWGAFGYK